MKLDINNTNHAELIAKYLCGEMDGDEGAQFEAVVAGDRGNKLIVETMRKDLELIGNYQPNREVDAERAWGRLYGRFRDENLIPEKKDAVVFPVMQVVKWAAIALLLIAIGGVSVYFTVTRDARLLSLQTGTDQATVIQTLSDGSTVYLASNTTLSYPSEFNEGQRKVNLQGEAFFDITHDPGKPFIIETEQAFVQVLGTSFNVNTKANEQLELIVERGKVKVTLKSNPGISQVVVAGEKIVARDNALQKTVNSNARYLLWRKKRMQFKDEKLATIISVINKNYNSKLELGDRLLGERRITVTFDNSLESITRILCVSLNLTSEVKADSTVVIRPLGE
jgi:ferric-dicitrate binding protein FerR (iron transport regulator)